VYGSEETQVVRKIFEKMKSRWASEHVEPLPAPAIHVLNILLITVCVNGCCLDIMPSKPGRTLIPNL